MNDQSSAHKSGCLVCGAELAYLDAAEAMACAACGQPAHADVRCTAGHFVCDRCHAGDAPEWIERVCIGAATTDPWELADRLMQSPLVKMHGPEHHFLVPAVLLAAAAEAAGRTDEKPAMLAKARRRAEQVLGGFCGTHGTCGAAVGVGIAVAVWTGSTPLKTREWQLSNLATVAALGDIARHGGPRCCKRDTWLALTAAADFLRDQLGVTLARGDAVVCGWYQIDRECQGEACPYRPGAPLNQRLPRPPAP
jgi:hypothetical protein